MYNQIFLKRCLPFLEKPLSLVSLLMVIFLPVYGLFLLIANVVLNIMYTQLQQIEQLEYFNSYILVSLVPAIIVTTAYAWISYINVRLVDAGSTFLKRFYAREVDDGVLSTCDSCQGMRNHRTHHCRICGICIVGYDHHCVFLHTCIGDGNYQYFIKFLFSTTLTLTMLNMEAMNTICAFVYLKRRPLVTLISPIMGNMTVIWSALSVSLSIGLALLLMMQIALLSQNARQLDVMDFRIQKMWEGDLFNIGPYSTGSFNSNARSALGIESWSHFFHPRNDLYVAVGSIRAYRRGYKYNDIGSRLSDLKDLV